MKLLFLAPLSLALVLSACQSTPNAAKSKKTKGSSVRMIPPPSAATSEVDPYMRANAAKPGVVTTASGLQYQIVESGPASGRSPTRSDTVTVHYRGALTNGTVFDSSIDRGQPATFGVGQVIPGWTEALQLMKPGDQWILTIPSYLAYGPRSMGDKIPPNSTLRFYVKLLEVN